MLRAISQGISPHPSLITLLCIKGGVKFNEEEEKIPKAFPLTLTGALNAPVEGKEVERRRKKKRTEEQPKEPVPTLEVEEESDSEERRGGGGGGFKLILSNPCSPPPLQKKQHQLRLKLKKEGKEELQMKRVVILSC